MKKQWLLFLLCAGVGVCVIMLAPAQYRVATAGIIMLAVCVPLLVWAWLRQKPVDVKDVAAGHGQHGKSRWMNNTEKKQYFSFCSSRERNRAGFCD